MFSIKTDIMHYSTVFLLLILAIPAFSQDLTSFHERYTTINTNGMYVLGGWAIANIGVGLTQWNHENLNRRYFHQMNVFWNGVNLAIAGAGYFSARQGLMDMTFPEALAQQTTMSKVLLVNAALDVAYMAGGFYLIERSKNVANKPERLRGFGQSVVMQGAFLMIFDVVMHQLNMSTQKMMFEHVALRANPSGLSLTIGL